MTQFVMVVEVFIAEGDAEDPLGQQLFERMLDQIGITKVVETFGQRLDHPQPLINLAKKQRSAIGSDRLAGELGNNFPAPEGLKS